MVKKYCFFFLLVLLTNLFPNSFVHSQSKDVVSRMQDSLVNLSVEISTAGSDSARLSKSEQFKRLLITVLEHGGPDEVRFDSINLLTKVTAPDKSFHLFTWAIPLSDGRFRHYGLLHIIKKAKNLGKVVEFVESIERPDELAGKILFPTQWFGAVYYKVVLKEYRNQRYYTLLGWHGTSSDLSKKVIEVLTFDHDESVRLGALIFPNYGEGKNCRIVFKFSSRAAMLLDYDEQWLPAKRKWNKEKKEFDVEQTKEWMIVCDDLVPSNPILEGQYEFYLPSSETFHGFVFEAGSWVFYQNIDARNR